MSLPTPNTRKEQYLNAIATGNASGLPTPITREEEYLDAIAKRGGGSGDGDMKKSVYDSDLAVANAGGISAFVGDAVDEVNSKSWSLGGGIPIANNTDLNNITTVGNYYATTAAAATLSHCPITGAFKLKVLYDVRESAPTYIEQVFNPISSYDEYRRYKSGSAEWSDWHLTNCNLDEVKGKVADNTSAIEAMVNVIFTPGRDLTVVFADEIADYSDEWAWIQARLDAHDVSGLRVGDYIPINIAANGGIAAETHKAEIAGINTYRRTGDSGHEVGYHIDWITRDCYSGTVPFNTSSNNNNGNASNSNPFLASNLKSWLDGTLYGLLDAKLKAVIKSKRILAPYRYQSGATLTDDNSWGWEDFTKLWVPLETEIFDCLVWSTKGFGNGQAVQYPIFANSYTHRIKGAGPGGARANWWTASAYSGISTNVVGVYYNGYSTDYNASNAICVPVCFRTMEA